MTVTAEGIEELEHLDYLREAGCGQGQGYLIGRAQPSDQLLGQEPRRDVA
jgi:EAL domain-containing protein (putative c-di-GMP-specific phosphodiesterase class I)